MSVTSLTRLHLSLKQYHHDTHSMLDSCKLLLLPKLLVDNIFVETRERQISSTSLQLFMLCRTHGQRLSSWSSAKTRPTLSFEHLFWCNFVIDTLNARQAVSKRWSLSPRSIGFLTVVRILRPGLRLSLMFGLRLSLSSRLRLRWGLTLNWGWAWAWAWAWAQDVMSAQSYSYFNNKQAPPNSNSTAPQLQISQQASVRPNTLPLFATSVSGHCLPTSRNTPLTALQLHVILHHEHKNY